MCVKPNSFMDGISNMVKKPEKEDVHRRDDPSHYWSGDRGKGVTEQDNPLAEGSPGNQP